MYFRNLGVRDMAHMNVDFLLGLVGWIVRVPCLSDFGIECKVGLLREGAF